MDEAYAAALQCRRRRGAVLPDPDEVHDVVAGVLANVPDIDWEADQTDASDHLCNHNLPTASWR